MTKHEILQLFPVFVESAPSLQNEMLEYGRYAKLDRGTYYARERDKCRQIAFVGTGRIRVYKVSETGREITLYYVEPGQLCLLNISCLMSQLPCPANAIVEEEVEAVVFSGDQFRHWVGSQEKIRSLVFDILANRVASIMTLVEEVAFRKMDQRLADYLYTRFRGSPTQVRELSLTHEKIAADLGSAREVISRLLKEFERENAVKLARGRILLEQVDVLKSLAGTSLDAAGDAASP